MELKYTKCKYCGKEMPTGRIKRHENCCVKNPENIASEEPIELNESNLEKVQNLPKVLKRRQSVKYICSSCGREILLKSFLNFKGFSTCHNCEREKTNIEKFGSKTPAQSLSVKEKIKKAWNEKTNEEIEKSNQKRKNTCKERYGVEAVAQDKEIHQKQIDTLISKSEEEKKKISEKRSNTMKSLYGVEHALQSPEFLEKSKNTSKIKYGKENIFQTEEFKKKRSKTCIEKYGDEFPIRTKEIQEKVKNTCEERYGKETYVNTEKAKKTLLEKYGIAHAPIHKYIFENEYFDSSWELAVWIWAKENNFEIKREPIEIEYEFEGQKHSYFPDFEINGKLIEIKGSQFFRNGKMINPYDESKNGLFEAKHQAGLKNNVIFWKEEEMKSIIDYIEKKYTKNFLPLFKKDIPFPYPELITKGDYDLIRYFHKSIFSASKKGKLRPIQAWENKSLVLDSALNRLKYVGRCTPQDILKGFSIAQIAPKVSVFRPKLAEKLIKKYIPEAVLIVDPFSGFSGRMLGAFNCGKQYLGFDINEEHVKESNEIIRYKKIEDKCEVRVQDLISFKEKDWTCLKNVYLFTCPPYEDKESWNENEVEKSCDEWIDLCLQKHKGCKGYLFVVDETEKYKDRIVEVLTNKSHFGTNFEYVVLI